MDVDGNTSVGAPTETCRAGRAALAGAVGGAVALGTTELLAGVVRRVPSLVGAVGDAVIDNAPAWLVRFGIDTFGTNDKVATVVGVVIVALAVAALLGVLSVRYPIASPVGFEVFAALGVVAAERQVSGALASTAAVAAASAGAGAGSMAVLLSRAGLRVRRRESPPKPATPPVASRRAFLGLAGSFIALAAVSATIGRSLARMSRAAAARATVVLPRPARPLAPASGSELEVSGLSSFFTPNADFYRIDEALTVPDVDLDNWRLRVTGLVATPLELTYDELLALPMIEADVTLACVSNLIGGDLIGNARWLGVPIRGLLDRAGALGEATQVVGRSVDGFTVGFPTQAATDGRSALVAVGMNGEPLPLEHGFPARLVVAGLYGYVSATKWLNEIELTTLEAFDAYWIRRGWSKRGPVKLQSRIDVPRPYAAVPAGPTIVAGVAWAPTRGIRGVEVQIDDGPWRRADVAASSSSETWRQWTYRWDADPGPHILRVRATGDDGEVQTSAIRGAFPDGATGLHAVTVEVQR